MSRALVTGGTGLVGRFIVERLLEAGHGVAVLGRNWPAHRDFSRHVGFWRCALHPETSYEMAVEGRDFIVHAALDHVFGKYRGGEGSDPETFRIRNHDGSVALFEAARRAGVRRAVFVSSRAVYGAQSPGEALTEETEPRPDNLYGQVKLETERALEAMASETFRPVSLRVTGVYGAPRPGQAHKWERLFSDFLAGRAIEPRVAGEVHGRDVAEAALMMLDAPSLLHTVYNVSDLVLDRHDLLRMVNEAAGVAMPLPARADASALNVMDTSRLEALGWRPGGMALLKSSVRDLLPRDATLR